jgi:alpha-tubulin suppressor-like RCC1 family protein
MMVCGVTLTVLGQAARAQDAGFDAEQYASAFCYTCGDTLSTGYYHTCGIEKNGTMHCWGSNAENQTRIPKQYVRFKARHNGTRVAWSILYEWHKSVPDPKTGELLLFNFSDANFVLESDIDTAWTTVAGWRAVSCGYSHTCGITLDGALLCWGRGKNQQSLLPQWVMAAPEINWRQVSCGTGHTCAIAANGTAACWGANDEGQIDLPPDVSKWTSISCGYAHTCGVASNGSGYCWGWNGITASTTVHDHFALHPVLVRSTWLDWQTSRK